MKPRAAPARRPRARLFYGWYVVLAVFAVTLFGFGSAYSVSTFTDALHAEFGASIGFLSTIFSLASFLYMGFGVFSGPLADRFGARRIVTAGMLVIGVGMVVAGVSRDIVGVYLGYGLGVGLGLGLAYVPAVGALQRWFVRRRGVASGLAVTGLGVGTLIMPPLAAWLTADFNLHVSFIVLGLLTAVVGGGLAILIVDDPWDRGLAPDGGLAPARDPRAGFARAASLQREGVSIARAIRSRRFIALYIASLLGAFALFVPFMHLVPYAQDHGIAPGAAVFLLSLIGIGSTGGRLFLGTLSDRMNRGLSLLIMLAGLGLSMFIWVSSTEMWSLSLFALAFGVFYGGFVAILPPVVMDDYGGRNVSGLIGVLYTGSALGALLGPSLAGYAFDLYHSYTLPIIGSGAAGLVGAVAVVVMMRAPKPSDAAQAR
ncbi:MAG TPA: MFS transporter [Nevskiaceae bacterium]